MPEDKDQLSQDEKIRSILRKVRQVELRTRRRVNNQLLGSYHSAFKGQGLHFHEIREYIPGDDVRSIDWNVTARMDKPFLKKFEEEREMTLALAVDLSASCDFGSGSVTKREMAAEIAAMLALSATQNQDKVALMLFSEQVEHWLPPGKGRQHVLRLIRDMLFRSADFPTTRLSHALEEAARLLHRRSVLFLLTDAFETKPESTKPVSDEVLHALRRVTSRHDVIIGLVHDPVESNLPYLGRITLTDPETGEIRVLKSRSKRDRERYSAWVSAEDERRSKLLRSTGVDIVRFRTDQAYEKPLQEFFSRRA